jgi:hypothetical protein
VRALVIVAVSSCAGGRHVTVTAADRDSWAGMGRRLGRAWPGPWLGLGLLASWLLGFWPFARTSRRARPRAAVHDLDGTAAAALRCRYVCQILEAGQSLEFFIEGTRSRTGKICAPKLGMLSVVRPVPAARGFACAPSPGAAARLAVRGGQHAAAAAVLRFRLVVVGQRRSRKRSRRGACGTCRSCRRRSATTTSSSRTRTRRSAGRSTRVPWAAAVSADGSSPHRSCRPFVLLGALARAAGWPAAARLLRALRCPG